MGGNKNRDGRRFNIGCLGVTDFKGQYVSEDLTLRGGPTKQHLIPLVFYFTRERKVRPFPSM